MAVDPDPPDPTHEYTIVTSDTHESVDGYHLGEPKLIDCDHCPFAMLITSEPTPGLWKLDEHEDGCPNAVDPADLDDERHVAHQKRR